MTKNNEKRVFPRQLAQCPVLYKVADATKWKVGIMLDMSATGIRLKTDTFVQPTSPIEIHIKPGSQKTIPEIKGSGKVVRCEKASSDYFVSCHLTKVECDNKRSL